MIRGGLRWVVRRTCTLSSTCSRFGPVSLVTNAKPLGPHASRETDETWAVADISVLTRLDEAYTVMHVSDFAANAAAGWEFLGGATAGTTTCGDFKLLGGYDVLAKGGSVVKTVTSMEEHTLLTISFEFVKLDTWDGEAAKLFVDDALVWTQAIGATSGTALYGAATLCGGTTADAIIPVTITVPHDETTAKIRFTTTLDELATNEACAYARTSSVSHAMPDQLLRVAHGLLHAHTETPPQNRLQKCWRLRVAIFALSLILA